MRNIHRAQFKNIGEEGDEKLQDKTVTIAGLGTVGSQLAETLAREDFDLRLVDKGRVEAEDMSRLNIFYEEDVTKFKVKQAKKRLEAINPPIKIKSFHEEITENNVFLVKSDLVIDATNHQETSKLIFDYCQQNKIPLVVVRYSESRVKVLVANKKLAAKHFDWLMDTGFISEHGVYSGCVMMASLLCLNRVMKFFLGDTLSYQVDADSWNFKHKETKL